VRAAETRMRRQKAPPSADDVGEEGVSETGARLPAMRRQAAIDTAMRFGGREEDMQGSAVRLDGRQEPSSVTGGLCLDLSANELSDAGADAVACLLEGAESVGLQISGLALTGNPLGVVGAVKLCAGIPVACHLRKLDLQACQLEAKGLIWLANCLNKAWGTPPPLKTRLAPSLAEYSHYDDIAFTFVPPLAELNLSGNSIGRRGGMKLVSMLEGRANWHPLQALGLRNNYMGVEAMGALAELLAKCERRLVWVECTKPTIPVIPAPDPGHDALPPPGADEEVGPVGGGGGDGTGAGGGPPPPFAEPPATDPAVLFQSVRKLAMLERSVGLGTVPYDLRCQYTAASVISEVRRRRGHMELSTDILHLIFSFLRVRVERRLAVGDAARE